MVVWRHAQVEWFRSVNDLSRETGWLHGPLKAFAEYGVVVFALLLLAGWWIARGEGDLRHVAGALWAPVGALVALGLNQPIVHAVSEARPYSVLPHALVLVHRSTDASFPSDHATMAGAVAVGIWLVNRRLGLVTAALAVLMAFARVYVGAHFPLDVVAGLLFGAVVALVSALVMTPLLTRVVTTLERTPLRPLLTAAPRSDAVHA